MFKNLSPLEFSSSPLYVEELLSIVLKEKFEEPTSCEKNPYQMKIPIQILLLYEMQK